MISGLMFWVLSTVSITPLQNQNFPLQISERLTIDALYLAKGKRTPTQGVFLTLSQITRIRGEIASEQHTYSKLVADLEQVCASSLAEPQRVCREQHQTLTLKIDSLESELKQAHKKSAGLEQDLSTLQNNYKYFRIGAYITTGLLSSALLYTALR